MVESINSVHAILPIRFAFESFDLKYFIPGHLVTKIKQIIGRIIENAYIHTCVWGVVESGAEFIFAPQFGQK
jgi:hypothetical protein